MEPYSRHIILRGENVPSLLEALRPFEEDGYRPFFRRFFIEKEDFPSLPTLSGAVSVVGQPPLDGKGMAMWAVLVKGCEMEEGKGYSAVHLGGTDLFLDTLPLLDGEDSYRQTSSLFALYDELLSGRGMTLEGNCARTWLFCDGIDFNYGGLVVARREHFTECGLLPSTHFIASTGIGAHLPAPYLVKMDALSVKGDFSIRYLQGYPNLGPTHEYGVTFERGAVLGIGEEEVVLVSGTASINLEGKILYEGDVRKQCGRMMENVGVLLGEAGSDWNDVMSVCVYLRNRSDYPLVKDLIAGKFPATPFVIVEGPVCRPGWLIEMECMAVRKMQQ